MNNKDIWSDADTRLEEVLDSMPKDIQALFDDPAEIFETDIEDPIVQELRDNPSILYPEAWDEAAEAREDVQACYRSHGPENKWDSSTWCDCGGGR